MAVSLVVVSSLGGGLFCYGLLVVSGVEPGFMSVGDGLLAASGRLAVGGGVVMK